MAIIGKFQIQNSFFVTGKGLVAMGQIVEGKVKIGSYLTFQIDGRPVTMQISAVGFADSGSTRKSLIGLEFVYKNEDQQREFAKLKITEQLVEISLPSELNGKRYDSWEEYIIDKFPSSLFNISEQRNDSSKIITVTSKDISSKTSIVFDFPTSDLCRIAFYHPDSPQLNAHNEKEGLRALMYVDYEITDENLKNANEYVNIPLYSGWTEQTVYYKGKLIQSDILYFEGTLWHTILLERNLNWFDKAGCILSLLAWPVLYIQSRFVKQRLTKGRRTSVNIPPMINK